MCQYLYSRDLLGGWFLPLNFSYVYLSVCESVVKTNEIFKRRLHAGSQECICAQGHEIFRAHTYSSAHVLTKGFVLIGTSVQLCSFCGTGTPEHSSGQMAFARGEPHTSFFR